MKTITYEDVKLSEESKERFKKTIAGDIKVTDEVAAKRLKTRADFAVRHSLDTVQDAFEKILGTNDLMPITYLQMGLIVAKSVGLILSEDRRPVGTAFLIAPGLLMTNNHVINDPAIAQNWWFRTDFELNLNKQERQSFFFKIRPDIVFFTKSTDYQTDTENLDFTIVAVEQTSETGSKSINDYGYLPAFEASGKIKKDEFVSIIQHPNGELKKVSVRENKVVADEHPDFIYYETDTDHGSSGSPVFNDDWVLVGLHHRGIPTTPITVPQNGDNGSTNDILLDANEGVRISSILKVLKARGSALFNRIDNAANQKTSVVSDSFENNSIHPLTAAGPGKNQESNILIPKNNIMQQNAVTLTVPLEITFRIGQSIQPVPGDKVTSTLKVIDDSSFERAKSRFPQYSGRRGYVQNFLEGIDIPLETLLQNKETELAPLLSPTDTNKFILKYTHYSLAIHKSRKLCVISAVNINGNELVNLDRAGDKWITDIRMDEKFQTGPEVYKNNDLDRGHMVRRLDPVWGSLSDQANDDTFHYTNSCPQHKDLNQKTWLGLEDFVLNNTNTNNLRVSVFNGPVFSEDDIPYRAVLLPLQYYKIVAMVKKDGTPSITAYVLSQKDMLLGGFESVRGEFVFGEYKTYQVPLKHIKKLTGLNLDTFFEFDPLNGTEAFESTIREIITGNEIKL